MEIKNKNVFVTGSTRGIGKAIALQFAKAGSNLIINGRSAISEELLAEFTAYGVKAVGISGDISKSEDAKRMVAEAIETLGSVDILVNNAGLALGLDKFQDYDLTDMMTMIDTNIKGLLTVTRQLLPQMVENNEGHIINIGSTAGIYAYAGAAVYAATKSAVKMLSDGIRIDTIDKNIKVTTLQPGIVETDFSQVRFHGDKERAATVYQGIDALQASDIAQCTLFVANQPAHVQISDMTIMATKQATGFTIHRE